MKDLKLEKLLDQFTKYMASRTPSEIKEMQEKFDRKDQNNYDFPDGFEFVYPDDQLLYEFSVSINNDYDLSLSGKDSTVSSTMYNIKVNVFYSYVESGHTVNTMKSAA